MLIFTFTVIVFSIIGLFCYSFLALMRTGKISPYILLQPILFGILYFLIFATVPESYQFDRFPEWFDWIEFTLAHVLRATDVLDAIEEFDIDIQNIKHASNLVITIIMIMHWMVDIFLLGLLWQIGSKYWKKDLFTRFNNKNLLIFSGLAILSAFLYTLIVQAYAENRNLAWILWNATFLWPLDNIIRVIDVGDSLQLYGIRLHQVKSTFFMAFISVVFRLLLSIPLAQFINWIHLKILSGIVKTVDELVEELGNQDTAQDATSRLMQLGVHAIPALVCALANPNPDIQSSAVDILAGMHVDMKKALVQVNSQTLSEIISALDDALADTAWHVQKTAAYTLGLLADKARPSVPKLVHSLVSEDQEVQDAVVTALNLINSRWWTMPETKSAIYALVKAILRKNAVDKKIPSDVINQITSQIKASVASLLKSIKHLGIVFATNETEFLKIASQLALLNRPVDERETVMTSINAVRNKPIEGVVVLVQVLSDLETRRLLQQKRSEAREIDFKTRLEQRKKSKSKQQLSCVNKNIIEHRRQNQGYRLRLLSPKQSRLLVTIAIIGTVSWVSTTEISKIKDTQSRYTINKFQYFVVDNVTGLMWQYCTGFLFETMHNAHCVFTNEFKLLYNWDEIRLRRSWGSFAGHNDWHVPDITELRTLVYCSSERPKRWNDTGNPCEGHYQQPTIIPYVFSMPKISEDMNFWSSSTDDNGDPLLINFSTGKQFSVNLGENKNFQAYKFLVRTGR